jgi:glycosyltransferase involved in cell wall biosynthesis
MGVVPPLVTVIVPTVGRRQLTAALQSVRLQSAAVELIVVVDGGGLPDDLAQIVHTLADRVLHTGGGRGAAHARNLGVRAARGAWIAYLDDDDEWLPMKLQKQLDALASRGYGPADAVGVASRALQRWSGRSSTSEAVPRHVYSDGSVADYLFVRRAPTVGRASVFLPTLLVSRRLANEVPWDESLRRHQDWDWLIRADVDAGMTLVQLEEALAIVRVGSPGSMSATADWNSSAQWALRLRDLAGDRVYVEFVAAQVLRYALQARSRAGIAAAARVFFGVGRPSIQSLALGLSGVLPRSGAAGAMRLLGLARMHPGGID